MNDNSKFYTIGYYICEPNYKFLKNKKIYSASECISNHHPKLEYYNFSEYKKSKYSNMYKINYTNYKKLIKNINYITEKNLILENDTLFKNYSDANYIYKKYFKKSNCKIIELLIDKKYIKLLNDDLSINYSKSLNHIKKYKYKSNSKFIGYDILGIDFYSYHSFLCNSLQKESKNIKLNKYCLISNNYSEIENFIKIIKNLGEPVNWLPYKIYIYN